jgi:hypothetical protein
MEKAPQHGKSTATQPSTVKPTQHKKQGNARTKTKDQRHKTRLGPGPKPRPTQTEHTTKTKTKLKTRTTKRNNIKAKTNKYDNKER